MPFRKYTVTHYFGPFVLAFPSWVLGRKSIIDTSPKYQL